MTIRIVVGLFAIFATGLIRIAAPVETFARGGAFAGARAMSLHRGFSAPVGLAKRPAGDHELQ